MPPYLAGRQAEQDFFRALLERLRDCTPLPSEVILYGPRGNGKTVLLGWLHDEAASLGSVETLVLLPSGVPDVTRLSELVLPKSWWERLTPQQIAVAGVSWHSGTRDRPPPPLEEVLAARARRAPLLVVVDEAHTLKPSVGCALLNASQHVRQRHPFLLVLAGTPNLRGHLGAMGASFRERAEQLRIGRIDDAATSQAIRRPFEAAGIRVEDDALAQVVRLSHGYPYFIQLLGRAVWRHVAGTREIPPVVTPAVAHAARADFERVRGSFYRQRYAELEAGGLLSVARSVAAAFGSREHLSASALTAAVRAGLNDADDDEAARRAEEAVSDLGFVWGAEVTPGWEPGIPSLMEYVLEFAAR